MSWKRLIAFQVTIFILMQSLPPIFDTSAVGLFIGLGFYKAAAVAAGLQILKDGLFLAQIYNVGNDMVSALYRGETVKNIPFINDWLRVDPLSQTLTLQEYQRLMSLFVLIVILYSIIIQAVVVRLRIRRRIEHLLM
ncbi:MAG: hypothetical protein M1503_04790 [Thaumarchaeota archaeon]|nr:hypothetical protein [Nitrososphaerota archaeon]MCL5317568.1 hypothetical protein [Nitrososphaerota archaeon]